MKSERKGVFDWKHIRLWRFASWARLLAMLVVIGHLFLAAAQAYQYNTFAHAQYQTDLLGLFAREPIHILDVSVQLGRILLQGLVYWLALKGIALALDMIVETDINYRDRNSSEGVT